MKKIFLLLGACLLLGIFAGIEYQKAQLQQGDLPRRELAIVPSDVDQISLGLNKTQWKIEKRKGQWWVSQPHSYPADAAFIGQALDIMSKLSPIQSFPLKEDHFGFDESSSTVEFVLKAKRLSLKIGTQEGPNNSLYILDKEKQMVFVYHNIWGQFLLYPGERFYYPYLPITGEQVFKIRLKRRGEELWEIESKNEKSLYVRKGKKVIESPKSQWAKLFKEMKESSPQNLVFDQLPSGKLPLEVKIWTDEGNIIFRFSEDATKLEIPSLNVFGQIDGSWLQSISEKINEVI